MRVGFYSRCNVSPYYSSKVYRYVWFGYSKIRKSYKSKDCYLSRSSRVEMKTSALQRSKWKTLLFCEGIWKILRFSFSAVIASFQVQISLLLVINEQKLYFLLQMPYRCPWRLHLNYLLRQHRICDKNQYSHLGSSKNFT